MAVHWKPSSEKVQQADYRSMHQWYESNRYREIIAEAAHSKIEKAGLLRTTNAGSSLRTF